ncbi:MAG: polyketide cyclase, partial [Candidatus Dadabacteria bacterium]|nr:polyketide cyclase [Candidatus Dadabacteria bacterium]
MRKKILIVVAVLILLFLVIVAIQPSDFRIARSINIAAPADVAFAQVNDLHKMDAWSPWLEPDPAV